MVILIIILLASFSFALMFGLCESRRADRVEQELDAEKKLSKDMLKTNKELAAQKAQLEQDLKSCIRRCHRAEEALLCFVATTQQEFPHLFAPKAEE